MEEDKGDKADKGGTAPVRRMHRYRERLRGPPVICHDLPIAALPCMLGCSFDNATALSATERALHMGEAPGTFICRGTLKCLRSQNVQRANVWVMEGKYRGPVTASVRSLHPEKFRSSSTLYLYLAPSSTGASTVTVDVPFLPQYLPVVTIFRFLGYETREAIEGVVFAGRDPAHPADAEARRRFAANFSDASMSKTLEELYEEAGSGMKKPDDTPDKRRRQVHMQITTELLPQVGYDDSAKTRLKKAIFLGLIIRDMLKVRVQFKRLPLPRVATAQDVAVVVRGCQYGGAHGRGRRPVRVAVVTRGLVRGGRRVRGVRAHAAARKFDAVDAAAEALQRGDGWFWANCGLARVTVTHFCFVL